MDAERWRKIESLYHSALQLEPSVRAAFLAEACTGDEPLRHDVDSLLAQADEGDGFLEERAIEVAARTLASARTLSVTAIGRYRIVRLLGEGGMGAVYEAEQDQPRRSVALKVIRPGLATPEQLWRFHHESQALGRLQHPGIAQIYEASTADAGFGEQPYFAMELIRGPALDDYARIQQLNARQKLALLVKVCDAVQHAHQRGLIHRDLKPGNILVDETGQPKILDFGVARVTGGDGHATEQTDVGQLVGTLAYMSPEHVSGDPLELDIRSDVYSLGVILYELLSGRPPYDVNRRQLAEALQTIRKEEPAALSLTDRSLRGDIETIVKTALEKDKERRYASAAELGADIQRYLNDEPIAARPPSTAYQLQKFARRHRAGVAVGGLALLALFSAAISVAWEARVARQERDRAQQRFNDVRGLARQVIFDLQTKLAALPGTTQVRKDLVAIAINYLDNLTKDGYADQGLQAELAAAYIRIGDVQGNANTQNLGDLPAALESYAKAERLARALTARQSSGQAMKLLGDALTAEAYGAQYANEDAKGTTKAMEALRVARARVRADAGSLDAQLQLGAALHCAASFYDGKEGLPSTYRLEEASLFENLLAHDPDNPSRRRGAALAHKYIAGVLLSKGPDGAFIHLKRAEELDAACVRAAPDNPVHKMDLAIDLGQWGEYYEAKNDLAKGIEYAQAALAIRRELASTDPNDTRAQDRLAYSLIGLGDMQSNVSARQALASYHEAKSIAERLQTQSLRAARLAPLFLGMGAAYEKLGDRGRSCSAYREAGQLYPEVVKQNPLVADELAEAEKASFRCRETKP